MEATETKPMTFKLFLEFIRFNAKTASAIPFLIGLLYSIYYFQEVNWLSSLIYFVAQMSIAFFVTGFNNVQDYKLAVDKTYRDTDNIIGREHLSPKHALHLMLFFLALSCCLGVWLVFRTNLLMLFMGAIGIGVTIFYTYGPMPFSRFPLGEILAGCAEGFGVFFLTAYINVAPTTLMGLFVNWPEFQLKGNLLSLFILVLVGLPSILADSNIMFADNICDLEQDQRNHRYTLPYYLGKKKSLKLYPLVILSCYVTASLAIILGLLPPEELIIFLVLPKIIQNIRTFERVQIKKTTFETAIHNLILFHSMQIIALAIAIVRTQLLK
ncbi:UbiA family prenyltransferase [Loigolactobacillus iwatensis]|uniref:UbiA family prenyltransferase n=1 Tax=Loigolactobacillus iwatensis TaxID=1267156 RepID=UPI001CDD8F71|nr:UbiA family prenyltransferase [Loigolactobacillus iwatensis]